MIYVNEFQRNEKYFHEVNTARYGRQVIKTRKNNITAENIVEELNNALVVHWQNVAEINYLDNYYRGDQPILYREKQVRPEINNKNVVNLAYYLVETKTADMVGEPIQFVLSGEADDNKQSQVNQLVKMFSDKDKSADDIELKRWASICGTSYRFTGRDDDEEFYFEVCDPTETFVVYYQNNRPAFSCQIREDEHGETLFNVYTDTLYFLIKNGKITKVAINGNGTIPVVEYPNNARRLSDIEITITITDEMNNMASNRSDGIEQFVSSWIKFVNCAIDEDLFRKMRQEGALVVKSNNGSENKADVDVITTELNQTQAQVAVSDMYEKFLVIHGLSNRQSSSGGDTKGAVELRDGHRDSEKRAKINEPSFKKAERQMLKIVLNRLRVTKGFTITTSDVEVKITRTNTDNILTKSECLAMLLNSGVDFRRAIKTVGIWSDPEQVASESEKRMKILYPDEVTEVTDDGKIENRPTE